jgi:hypothetical protein
MKTLLAVLLINFFSLSFANAGRLTCTYVSTQPGCTGQPRVKSAKIEIRGDKFAFEMFKDACYYHGKIEYRGEVKGVKQSGSKVKVALKSKAKRDALLGEDRDWKADNTAFKLTYDKDTNIAKITKLDANLVLQCN